MKKPLAAKHTGEIPGSAHRPPWWTCGHGTCPQTAQGQGTSVLSPDRTGPGDVGAAPRPHRARGRRCCPRPTLQNKHKNTIIMFHQWFGLYNQSKKYVFKIPFTYIGPGTTCECPQTTKGQRVCKHRRKNNGDAWWMEKILCDKF